MVWSSLLCTAHQNPAIYERVLVHTLTDASSSSHDFTSTRHIHSPLPSSIYTSPFAARMTARLAVSDRLLKPTWRENAYKHTHTGNPVSGHDHSSLGHQKRGDSLQQLCSTSAGKSNIILADQGGRQANSVQIQMDLTAQAAHWGDLYRKVGLSEHQRVTLEIQNSVQLTAFCCEILHPSSVICCFNKRPWLNYCKLWKRS